MKRPLHFQLLTALALTTAAIGQQPADLTHHIVAIEKDRFHGWPANNGVWHWGDEILVGFTQGDFVIREGHNIGGIQQSKFARSTDGGESWTMFDPENFLDDENIQWLPEGKKKLETPVEFTNPGFALRVFATGYHGNNDPEGGFYYSYDRGATWQGPWFLGDIPHQPAFEGMTLTPRTDYIVLGKRECVVFITANGRGDSRGSRVACIRTKDGGMTFNLVAWVTPETEASRAIMPSTVQLDESRFLLTCRTIYQDRSEKESTIDAFLSEDGCKSWRYLSTVMQMKNNSNPPATVKLADGRICCVYGDRDQAKICGKYSADDGKAWGEEFVVRDGYQSLDDWADMGYPRLVQRTDGKLVAMYYWATAEHPQHHIAASIWTP